MKLSSGAVLKSRSGRELSPVPKIDCTSDRKCVNTLKRVHRWMKEEALLESPNEFVKLIVSGVNPDKPSPADVDVLNDVLWG